MQQRLYAFISRINSKRSLDHNVSGILFWGFRFLEVPPHLTNAPHTKCEGLAPHVRRTYNIKRIGKTSAGVW